jgi:hypothetical protein
MSARVAKFPVIPGGRHESALAGWPARRAEHLRKLDRLIVLYPNAVAALEALTDDYLDDARAGGQR